jgi:hypothetical protein
MGVGGGDVDDRVVGRPRWHGPPPGRHRGSGPQARPPVAQPGVVAGGGVVERPGPRHCRQSRRRYPRVVRGARGRSGCRAWWSCRTATSPSPCAPGARPPAPTAIPSPNARMRCNCPAPSTTAGAPTAPWAPRTVNCWPPPCARPRPRTITVSRPVPPRPGGPMPWVMSAGSSWTTSRPGAAVATGRISTWCSTSSATSPTPPPALHPRRHPPRPAHPRPAALRLGAAPGAHGGAVDDPGLRHRHANDPGPVVQRVGDPRPPMPLPRLRPAGALVRGSSRPILGQRGTDAAIESCDALQQASPLPPPARLARQTPPRRHPRDHRPPRPRPHHQPTIRTTTTPTAARMSHSSALSAWPLIRGLRCERWVPGNSS